jgi:hypothetical protein
MNMHELGILTVLCALALTGVAQAADPSPWTTGTKPRTEAPPAVSAEPLTLRVYDDRALIAPCTAPASDQPAYAVDVSAVFASCPDGSRIVTALVIGGQRTPLDNRCPVAAPQPP